MAQQVSDHVQRLPQVEKDVDDPTNPPSERLSMEERASTTSTTLNRLLGALSLSPEDSRASSYMGSVQQHGYIRNINTRQTTPLPHHLFTRGLCQGKHSDITVNAFGVPYQLHRIILDRAPFFATALSGPWLEAKSSEITIRPEEIDSNITQHGFELALKRLYRGTADFQEEDRHAVELFATGCWMEMPDLIDASIESILRQMSTDTLGRLVTLVTKNYYGRSGDKILASAKAMLCRDGWRMPSRYWDSVPAEIVNEIISSDGFYVNGEWERWVLAKRIATRRLKMKAVEFGRYDAATGQTKMKPEEIREWQAMRSTATPSSTPDYLTEYTAFYGDRELAPLLDLLINGIHYVHLEFEQLQYIRTAEDVLGVALLPDKVVSTALWQQMELRQRILNSAETDLELGLAVEIGADDDGDDTTDAVTSAIPPSVRPALKQTGPFHHNKTNSGQTAGARQFWIPSTDCNIVMGGNSDPVISISNNGGSLDDSRSRPRVDNKDEEAARPVCYSTLPPFRFSAEFPSPKLIKEKKRAYSRTIFYAGSLWNIYIQKVASPRSTKQLGVYLHRVKERETEAAVVASPAANTASSVKSRAGPSEREPIRQHRLRQGQDGAQRAQWEDEESPADAHNPQTSQSSRQSRQRRRQSFTEQPREGSRMSDRSKSAFATVSSSSYNEDSDSDIESDWNILRSLASKNDDHVPALPAYVDSRPTIKTYFKIYSPSRGGRMLSVYESAPDKFNFSQSWGWKSSTLMLDEGLSPQDDSDQVCEGAVDRDEGEVEDEDATNLNVTSAKVQENGKKTIKSLGDGKLRFMVAIGIL